MSTSKKSNDRLVFGQPPRADLLPPEFRQEATLRRQRRSLIAIAVLAIVVVLLGYGYATFGSATSDLRYQAALAETQSLLEQKKDYADISSMQGRVAAIKAAQIVGSAPEIDWKTYLSLVDATFPDGMSMDSVGAVAVAPGRTSTSPNSPLEGNNIATLDFQVRTRSLPSISQWIENLGFLPGFVNADASSISKSDSGEYTASVTMHIDSGALAHRFDADLPDPVATEPETDEVTP
jgi:Tfp pilus assembly protein PilN